MTLVTFNPKDSEILKKMVECMGDSQEMVRLSLAETLDSIGKPAPPFLLEALAHHPNPVVGRASAKTLTLICEAIARTSLLEAFLQDEDRVGGGRVGLKTKPAVSNRAYTDKTHLEGVKEILLDRALTFSSQNESISIVCNQKLNHFKALWKTKKQIKEKQMHLISIRNLRKDAAQYPDVKNQIDSWNDTVKKAEWQNLEEVRKIYRDAEVVGDLTVFNIKGNEYRLIVGINYENQTIYYKYFLTHAEYEKDKWKNDPYF